MTNIELITQEHALKMTCAISYCDRVEDAHTQAAALSALKKIPFLRDELFDHVGIRYVQRLNELGTMRFRAFEALAHTTNGHRGAEVDPVYQGLVAASALREYVEGVQTL